ncbi:MAG: PIN domain-containing protein [Chloroflexi bacterium]|nr:PIN domain-containing protein [Chloroflexota bacterium]
MRPPARPRVLVDADTLLAACASPSEHGASLMVLRMAEITLIEALAPTQVIEEVRRNLEAKLPEAWPAFSTIVSRCLHVLPDPSGEAVSGYRGLAHAEDLPILVAAVEAGCQWLVTFNVRHYQPGHPDVAVVRPGEFVVKVRDLLSRLSL